jgi:hypothetical protein
MVKNLYVLVTFVRRWSGGAGVSNVVTPELLVVFECCHTFSPCHRGWEIKCLFI